MATRARAAAGLPRRRPRPRRAGRRDRRRADLARRRGRRLGDVRRLRPLLAASRWRSATCPPRSPRRARPASSGGGSRSRSSATAARPVCSPNPSSTRPGSGCGRRAVSPLRALPTIDDLAGDAHPHLARLRAAAPVAWVPALASFLVSGWAPAVEVLRDPETFTVDDPRFSTARVVGSSMLSLDGASTRPPPHAVHGPVSAPSRRRAVRRRRPAEAGRSRRHRLGGIRGRAARATGRTARRGGRRRQPRPRRRGGRIGVARLLGWYRAIVDSVSTVGAGRPRPPRVRGAMDELGAALLEHLAEETGDHGSLLQAAMSDGELDPDEVVSNAAVIMFGGIETTEGMILNAVWYLLREPDLRRRRRPTTGTRAGGSRGVAADRAGRGRRRPLRDARRRAGRRRSRRVDW